MDNTVQIGKLQRTHGLKGHLHLFLDPDKDVLLEEIKFMMVSLNGQLVPFFIENIEERSGKLLVKFENTDTENDAKKLVNAAVFTTSEFIEEAEASELSEFIGYLVKDEVFGELGPITGIQEFPKHYLFAVDHKGKEVLLPATDDLIISIDDNNRVITYSAPEGLIELYLGS
jgi:16S rRNA processing protein RimM